LREKESDAKPRAARGHEVEATRSGHDSRADTNPDRQSQFMHFLESMKYQVTADQKLNRLLSMVEDVYGKLLPDVESPREASYAEVNEDGYL